jgi:pyruvate dehydrogenase E1 component beta subunit
LTIRSIINRGGEQGAQHSQALHAWFAHVPGLRVVMPATVADARDLLIASVLSPDPVMFIDDRWLYDLEDDLPPVVERLLSLEGPRCVRLGNDVTIVASSYSTRLALESADLLQQQGISADVIDLRVINPLDPSCIVNSVEKTGRLLVIDGGWGSCGLAGEIIASVVERVHLGTLKKSPTRITLPFAPAPTARVIEQAYYPNVAQVIAQVKIMMDKIC